MAGSGLEVLIVELLRFVAPLRQGFGSAAQLAALLERLGYRLAAGEANAALAALAGLDNLLADLTEAAEAMPEVAALSAEDLATLGVKIVPALQQIDAIATSGNAVIPMGIDDKLVPDLQALLLNDYLVDRVPIALPFLEAVGALTHEPVAAGVDGRTIAFTRYRFTWSRLGQLVDDFDTWAREVYGWGDDFQHDRAILRLAEIFLLFGPGAQLARMTDAAVAAFVRNPPGGRPPLMVELPLFAVFPVLEEAEITAEAGIAIMPVGDLANGAASGLGFAPYARGGISGRRVISENLALDIAINPAVVGGRIVAVKPSGVSIEGGSAVDGAFQLGLRYGKAAPPTILVGSPGETRVEIDAAHVAVGGELDGGLFVAAGVERLRLVVDLSEDGLFGSVLSTPLTIEAGDFLLGWRPGRGVYFEGGSSLGVVIPLDLQLGAVNVHELGLFLDWKNDLAITTTVTGDLRVGPLYLYLEGLGLQTTLVKAPERDGVLGAYDLDFALRMPTAYAIELASDAITGGGLLSISDHEYRGALALRIGDLGFSAYAILNTQLPNGARGFSFVGSIFVELTIPLGFGFLLTGLGGIIGLHRTTDTSALRDVLFEGSLDALLFPADPIASADTILDDLGAIFPTKQGTHLFGPVARIAWGQPVMIEGKLGLVLEVGEQTRLLILGTLSSDLPDEDSALVSLRVSFFGEIDFAAGTMSLDATLQGSRVLAWPVSGDMALRTGWKGGVEHVISFGGLHPRYPRPANLPDLRRMSINFGTNNPKITLSGYEAITMASLQFGARAELYAKGPKIPLVGRLAAEGSVYFDAIIYTNPFAFDAELGGSLAATVDGEVKAGLGFQLRFTGPNPFKVDGKVWARICRVDVDFPIEHTWGQKRSVASPVADPLVLLRDALLAAGGFEPTDTTGRSSGVAFQSPRGAPTAFDPVGGLRYVQRVLPLRIAIAKVGEAAIAGDARTFDIALYRGGVPFAAEAAMRDFVRGHFWALNEDDRLRAPAFASHKAGVEIVAGGGLISDQDGAIDEVYDYEIINLDDDAAGAPAVVRSGVLPDAFADRWGRATIAGLGKPRTVVRTDAPVVRPTTYVTDVGGRASSYSAIAASPAAVRTSSISAAYVAAALQR